MQFLTDARPPPQTQTGPFWVTPPSSCTGHGIQDVEYPFGQFGCPVTAVLPPSFFHVPPH